MRVAANLQALRSSVTDQRSRLNSDQERWTQGEVALSNSIQELLAVVARAPAYSDGVYKVLDKLQAVLESGRSLAECSRQLVDDEDRALSEFERDLQG